MEAMEAVENWLTNPDTADVSDCVRAQIDQDPVTMLRIATAISNNRGQWPAESVTAICREKLACLDGTDLREVVAELERCLLGRDIDEAMQWLHVVGIMHKFLPEVDATVDLVQEGGRKHKDVWEHTKLVVKQAVRRPAVRWGALLHDIGKVPTRRFTKNGVHFHGHAEVGARMFDKVSRRLPFERSMRRKIRFLIKYHLRSAQYEPSWTDSAIRRFHREMQEHLTDLLDLSRADITSRRPGRRRFLLGQIKELENRIAAINELDARVPPLPTGLGTTIMSHFGLPPSRLIGDIKRALEAAVESGALEQQRDDAYYIAWVESSGLLPGSAEASAESPDSPDTAIDDPADDA